MSRSGYSDDYEFAALWEQAVRRATAGYRGQHLLQKLLAAMDALPLQRLITGELQDTAGDVCALGALDATAPAYDAWDLAEHFGIARALAAEICYQNDEYWGEETPEQRWVRMRMWVAAQIVTDES